MFSRCLVLCLAVGLVGAEGPISCSNIRPLSNLDLTQVLGDWLMVHHLSFDPRGVATPPNATAAPPVFHTCFYFHLESNSSRGLSTRLDSVFKFSRRNSASFEYEVDAKDKAKWRSLASHNTEILVVAAVPRQYFVSVTCTSSNTTQATPTSMRVFSRYDPQEFSTALNQQQLTNVVSQLSQTLGIPSYQPRQIINNCFRPADN